MKQSSRFASDSNINENGNRAQSVPTDVEAEKRRIWQVIGGATSGVSTGTRRFLGFMRWKLHIKRGKRETAVKEIHIAPELDERWAHVPISSGNNSSRSNSGSSNDRPPRETVNINTVHDMDEESYLGY